MIRYLPWRDDTLRECIRLHNERKLPTLDLDLTAKCTFARCIYCDSKPGVGKKNPDELTTDEMERVLREAGRLGTRWIYTCGLGEPLEDDRFLKIVETSFSLGIRISLFTNAIGIDRKLARWLRSRHVCLIVKLDSFVESNFDKIIGINGRAKKIYEAIENLLEAGYGSDDAESSELALSIVPTKVTLKDIPDVVLFAKEHNLFPSIGELEQAGLVISNNVLDKLSISDVDLHWLRYQLDKLLWPAYKRPICPSIITGIHIDNLGDCIVDAGTGLNCKWFLLKESPVHSVGNVKDVSLNELLERAQRYRREMFSLNSQKIAEYGDITYEFGGCGGDPATVIRLAKEYI